MIERQLGTDIAVSTVPRLLLRFMGLFNPTIRELDEMRDEFTQQCLGLDEATARSG